MSELKHTEGKLTAHGTEIRDETGERIADAYSDALLLSQDWENAVRLAHRWNCHDDILEALKRAEKRLREEAHSLDADEALEIISKAKGLLP